MVKNFMSRWRLFLCTALLFSACSFGSNELIPEQPTFGRVIISPDPIRPEYNPGSSDSCEDESVLCIGFMTDGGSVDDGGFYQAVWAGVQRAEYDLAAYVTKVEPVSREEVEAQFEAFVNDGFDIVLTAGYGLLLPTMEAAERYPNTKFIGVDQDQTIVSENLTGVVLSQEKAGFLAGVLAGLLTKSDTVGAVLGTVYSPTYRGYREGFNAGVSAIDPSIKVILQFNPGGIIDGPSDPDWGKKAAEFMLDNGADVIFAAGGETAAGALAEVASTGTAHCIGAEVDQYLILPDARDCLVASAMRDIEQIVFISIASAVVGLDEEILEGAVELSPFYNYDSYMTADVKLFFENLEDQLSKGMIPTDGSQIILRPPQIDIPK